MALPDTYSRTNSFFPSPAAPQDMPGFLRSIGAAGLDSNGRPVGSTGGGVSINQEQEQQLGAFRQPQQAATAPAGPTAANPLAKLNATLGLNIGAPTQGLAMRQATDSLPGGVQVAGAIGESQDQNKAALFARRMAESGGFPVAGSPEFAERSRAATLIYEQIYGSGANGNTFLGGSSTYAPTGLRDRAIAAGGEEVVGAGGALVSREGTNAAGGNRFMLRQGAAPASSFMPQGQPVQAQQPANRGPSEAAMRFLRDGTVPTVNEPAMGQEMAPVSPVASPVQQAPSALEQAQGVYRDTVASVGRKGPNLPPGYEVDPAAPGAIRPIPGSPDDAKRGEAEAKRQERVQQEIVRADVILNAISDVLPRVDSMTAGFGGTLMNKIPGTEAKNVAGLIDTVKANIGFEQLQQMRNSSPTGGALGQVAVKELDFLQASLGNLSTEQTPAQVRKTLGDIQRHYSRWKMAISGQNPDEQEQAATGNNQVTDLQAQARALLEKRRKGGR